MKPHHNGIHHITALSGDAQRNADFYVKKLGMRLVKKSVNQDDPGTYHLFYGNAEGDPGSGLTFFPWPMAAQGKPGMGEAVSVGLAVPTTSMDFWAERFGEEEIDFEGPTERFGKTIWRFKDPDLMQLELVFDEKTNNLPAWSKGTVPEEYGIRGFWGTTLQLREAEPTAKVLEEVFGFNLAGEKGKQKLYTTDAPFGSSVIIETIDPKPSANGRGIIHHVAFRAKNDEELAAMRKKVLELGLHPTEYIDRFWFHSVYFRSPGGVLFEIATDGPGYVVDEDADKLGQKLVLPPWLEPKREMIEKRLPEIRV
ncbi:MAG TPA: ring-cleaving dioxygenase [Flavobacteriaceae bacterium]|nr:ring-cleaving dioxygenase [Flavobacteriaceae bacterium]